MSRIRVRLTCAAVLALVALGPATASAQGNPAREVVCESQSPQAICQFVAAGLLFEALRQDIADPSDREEVHVVGELALVAGPLELVIEEVDALFVRLASGTLWIQYGLGRAPLSSLPLLEDARLPTQAPLVGFGLADRYELMELFEDPDDPDTWLPLAENPDPNDPEQLIEPTYLFFHAVDGMDLSIPVPLPDIGSGGEPISLPLSKSQATTIILDPSDPYVYFSNAGGNGLDKKLKKKAEQQLEKRQQKQRDQEEARRQADEDKRKREAKQRKQQDKEIEDQDKKKKKKKDKNKKKKNKKKKKKKKKGLPKGTIAFSAKGGIPYDADRAEELAGVALDEQGAHFNGHLFVKLPIPMGPFIGMDGPTVLEIDQGIRMGGDGEADVTLPFVGDILGLSLPLGTASAGLTLNQGEQSAYFAGRLSPGDSPFADIVPIAPKATLEVSGLISSQLEKSFLLAEGRYELDASELGKLAGVELGSLQSIDGVLRLDREGFLLQGTSRAPEIHPSIGFDGKIQVTAFFSGPNPLDSYVRILGQMSVGGIDLGAGASLLISPTGVIVEGYFATGLASIELLGELTIRGPVLQGRTRVTISLDDLNQALADAKAEVQKAQAAVEHLEVDLAGMRNTVRDERRRNSKAFQDAQAGVGIAQREVNRLNGVISSNNSTISGWKSDKRSWERKSCRYNPICAGEKAAKILWLKGKIAALEATNWTLKNVTLPGAKGILDQAKKILAGVEAGLHAIPIDADPRVAFILSELGIAREALNLAELALSFEIPASGTLAADITLRLDRKGISGTLNASLNGVPVTKGKVKLGSRPKACITLATLGSTCARF